MSVRDSGGQREEQGSLLAQRQQVPGREHRLESAISSIAYIEIVAAPLYVLGSLIFAPRPLLSYALLVTLFVHGVWSLRMLPTHRALVGVTTWALVFLSVGFELWIQGPTSFGVSFLPLAVLVGAMTGGARGAMSSTLVTFLLLLISLQLHAMGLTPPADWHISRPGVLTISVVYLAVFGLLVWRFAQAVENAEALSESARAQLEQANAQLQTRARRQALRNRIGQAALEADDVGVVQDDAIELLREELSADAVSFEPRRCGELALLDAWRARSEHAPTPDVLSSITHLTSTDPQGSAEPLHALITRRPGAYDGAKSSGLVVLRRGEAFSEEDTVFVQGVVESLSTLEERHLLGVKLGQSQRLESIGQLAGGVAHDFNNLLTVMQGGMQMARYLTKVPACQLEIDIALEATRRATALTRQLLVFSHLDQDEPSPIDLCASVRRLEAVLSRLLPPTILIVVDAPEEACVVFADQVRLDQIVINLVLNARDAIGEGAGEIALRVASQTEDASAEASEWVTLEVRDDGSGMSEETLERLFEPFFTTKPLGKGTGLGLSVVHGAVLRSGGQIDVTSALGEGTLIRVRLPRIEAAVTDEAASRDQDAIGSTLATHDAALALDPEPLAATPARDMEPALDPEPSAVVADATFAEEGVSGARRILLVEDDALVRGTITRMLEHLSFEVRAAENAEEALIQLSDARPDLVISDVRMPGMSGVEFASILAREQPGIPIMLITGYADEVLARDEGTFQLLRKPFTQSEMKQLIYQSLRLPPDDDEQQRPGDDGILRRAALALE